MTSKIPFLLETANLQQHVTCKKKHYTNMLLPGSDKPNVRMGIYLSHVNGEDPDCL